MQNYDIRQNVQNAGLKLWEVAYKLGMRDNEFSRKLRIELTPDEKTQINKIIKELQNEKNAL